MHLCTFSKSEILADQILALCPLDLNSNAAKKCPCRKREYHVPPADLRVLRCTYPDDFRGNELRDPAAVTAKLMPAKKARAEKEAKVKEKKIVQQQQQLLERSHSPMTDGEANNERDSREKDLPAAANPQQQTGVSIYRKIGDPVDFIAKMGQTLYDSKMFGLANAAQGRALVLGFMIKGIDPFDFMRRNHVIGGQVSMKSSAMLSDHHTLVGGDHRIVERTPQRAALELKRGKDKYLFEFSWEEAKSEDYVWTSAANKGDVKKFLPNGDPNPAALKDNWSTPRRRMQMLWQRVVSDGVKAVSPEVNHGLYTPEELGANVDDDIVDAEFEIKPDSAPAKVEPEKPLHEQADADQEADAADAERAAAGDPPLTPAQEILSEAADGVDPAKLKTELLLEVQRLKKELGTPGDKWKEFLVKNFQTESAKELDNAKLQQLVDRLAKNLAKRDAGKNDPAKPEPVNNNPNAATEAWANNAAGQKLTPPATEGSPAGN